MMNLSRRALMASFLGVAASCATRPIGQSRPAIGSFGIDLSAQDASVKAGDDFYRFANGTWLATTQIPPDRTSWGAFQILDDKADRDARAIIEEVAVRGGAAGSNEQKIKDFYNSYLDVAGIETKGMAAFQADLSAIAALRTHEQTIRLIAAPNMPVASPISLYVTLDEKNPDRYVVGMSHAGLGLGEREYYLGDSAQLTTLRGQYRTHIARVLTIGGIEGGEAKARNILSLETQIARLHWPIARRRDRTATYNLKTRAEINALEPRFPWDAMFEAAELNHAREAVVSELSAMGPLAQLYLATPVARWRDYLTFHYLSNVADVAPRALDDEHFAFYGRILNGQPEQRERWRRGVDAANSSLGEAVGQIYVTRHFPPEAKQQMLDLVENLRAAYGERFDRVTWMSPETKTAAHEKLATFRPKIGYPDRWRDYSALDIQENDAFGNFKRAMLFEWRRDAGRLNQPTDKDEWFMTPQTVNAYYNSTFNEIVFPAAILQPPFFDPNADDAVNYGGIGGVIGHEMGHGFDDQGAKSDARGVLRDWWSEADVTAFQALTQKLVDQYAAYEALPGLHINGELTLGENIGDNGGLQVAHEAYQISVRNRPGPAIEGFTSDQRFFLSWAQVWRTLIRDERLRNLVMTDPHSPAKFRCNGVVRNMDEWYAAFNVQPGDALYLPPDQRVHIW
jgi:putative endopeptidase